MVNSIVFDNIKVMNSEERTKEVTGSFIEISGAANISISNSEIEAYGVNGEEHPPVALGTGLDCNPSDSVVQNFDVSNITFFAMDSWQSSQIMVNILEIHQRDMFVTISDINVVRLGDTPLRSLFEISTSQATQTKIENLEIDGLVATENFMTIRRPKELILENLEFLAVEGFQSTMILVEDVQNLRVNNLTIDN